MSRKSYLKLLNSELHEKCIGFKCSTSVSVIAILPTFCLETGVEAY